MYMFPCFLARTFEESLPFQGGVLQLLCVYCSRLETLIFCACLFPFDFAFALASWQEDCFELHASSHKKIQGIKSTFQADRSIRDFGLEDKSEKMKFKI